MRIRTAASGQRDPDSECRFRVDFRQPNYSTSGHVESVAAGSFPMGQHAIRRISQQALSEHRFATRSMKPKVAAARVFVLATGRPALIGSLDHIESTLANHAGTADV